MSGSYMPSREPELRDWVVNFRTLVAASPAVYALVAADATVISAAVDDFVAKYLLATDPATRTLATVADKDGAKAEMVTVLRSYVARIKATPGVTDADKVILGLNPVRNPPTPVPPPGTYPLVTLSIPASLRITVALADATTPDSRARPRGAVGCQVFHSTAATPPEEYLDWRFAGFVTRNTFELAFNPADDMKRASVVARWQNAKGETGPWSPVHSMAIVKA